MWEFFGRAAKTRTGPDYSGPGEGMGRTEEGKSSVTGRVDFSERILGQRPGSDNSRQRYSDCNKRIEHCH